MAKKLKVKTNINGEINLKEYNKEIIDNFILELYYAMNNLKPNKKVYRKK